MPSLRYAVRQLRQSPGFALTAILTLALGIGATTAIFSAVYTLLLKSLPFADADHLIALAETHPQAPGNFEATFPDYEDWRAQQSSFTDLAAYSVLNPSTVSVVANGQAQQLHRVLAAGNFFSLLGVEPLLGRTLTPADDTISSAPVAVLTHTAWQRYFGSNPAILNHPIDINGSPVTIVGILPPGAAYPAEGDIFLPLARIDQAIRSSRVWHSVRVLGRLRPSTTLSAARADMQTIAARLAAQYPATNRSCGVTLNPIRDQLVGSLRPAILTLFAAVLLVLLIACANVANLLLVRSAAQRRQIAVRQALGASRRQLFAQSLAQTLLLSLLGGVLGLALAAAALPVLRLALAHTSSNSQSSPQSSINPALLASIHLNLPVLAAAIAACTLTAFAFSLIPALHTSTNITQDLRPAAPGGSPARSPFSRAALIGGEIAIAVLVLFLGSLVLRSYQKITAINPGFATDHLLTAEITLPEPRYTDFSLNTFRFYQQLIDRLNQSPGILHAATTNQTPLQPSQVMTRFLIQGEPTPAPGVYPLAQMRFISPSYLETLGLHLLSGRNFTQAEAESGANLLLVNQAFADRYLVSRNPVGATILMGVLSPKPDKLPVIGVVQNARDLGVSTPPQPEIYLPGYGTHAVVLIHSKITPEALIPTLVAAVHSIDKAQPIYNVATADRLLADSVARQRLTALLLGIFAVVAVALAAIGIYGVLSVSVAQRTREIGIRMAIGASRMHVLGIILTEAARFTAVGLACGMLASLIGARLLSSQLGSLLFETSPLDPFSIAMTLVVLATIAVVAAAVPAARAAQTNPASTLRAE